MTESRRTIPGTIKAWTRGLVAAVILGSAGPAWSAEAKTAEAEAEDREFPGQLRLVLPKVIHAAPGVEMNVYFDNVVLAVNPANYAFDVNCRKGVQQSDRWTCVPKPEDAGEHPFEIQVRDQSNAVVARAKSTIKVPPATAGAGAEITLLIVGDSLTAASVYSQHVLDLCQGDDNPKLTLIGTRVRGEGGRNRHEGYGGWTAHRFATHYTGVARGGDYKKCGSPFIYKDGDAKPRLDFARYCQEHCDGRGPDFVTILLGCNDTFSSTDETIEERIDVMFKHYDVLLKMIHGVRPDTKIGALLLVPPAGEQDAFGANYKCSQTRWQYKRNQQRVVERMMESYAGRESENIYLVAANVNLDCQRNYPQRKAPVNARTAAQATRLANGVHPSAEGYRQIGDAIYGWLKTRLAEAGK